MDRSEYGYLRTLADVDDGHIGIYATVHAFNEFTGEPLPAPIVLSVGADREAAFGIPDRSGPWWNLMIERGHLELAMDIARRWRYRTTAAGREWLAEHRIERPGDL